MLTGSCLCGDIAFEIDGPVDTVGHCHCSMCRKFHGSARAALGTTAPEDFRWVRGAERIRTYQSSAQGCRSFCPRCGSPSRCVAKTGRSRSCAWAMSPKTPARARACISSPVPWRPGTPSSTICRNMKRIRRNSGRALLPWTVPHANRKRRAPSEKAAFGARSHSNSATRPCGCATATAHDADAP